MNKDTIFHSFDLFDSSIMIYLFRALGNYFVEIHGYTWFLNLVCSTAVVTMK